MNGLLNDLKLNAKACVVCILILCLLLPAGAAEILPVENGEQSQALRQSITESLQLEKDLLVTLGKDQEKILSLAPELKAELEDYKILYTTYTNLLTAQQIPDAYSLEQADARVKAAQVRVRDRLDLLTKRLSVVQPLRTGLNEQQAINAAYLKELRKTPKKDSEQAAFIENLQSLIAVINQKRQYLDKIHDFYQTSITQFSAVQEDLGSLSNRISTRLKETRNASQRMRRTFLTTADPREKLIKETEVLGTQLKRLLSPATIKNEVELMRKSGGKVLTLPILLFVLMMVLALRLRRYCPRLMEKPTFVKSPAFLLALRLFNRSAILLLVTIFFIVYTQADDLYVSIHIFILSSLLQVFLFTKWGLDAIPGLEEAAGFTVAPAFQRRLRALLVLVRYYIAVYLVLAHLTQPDSILLSWMRLTFAVLLIIWCLDFWKTDRRLPPPLPLTRNDVFKKEIIKFSTYAIVLGGLAFEITGYGGMTFFWYAAWGRTLVAGLWAILLYAALRQLSLVYQVVPDQDRDPTETAGSPVTWLFLKLGQPLVIVAFAAAVIMSWGSKRAFLIGLVAALGRTYRIGNIELSIMGFVYALAVLLITHIATQAWRYVFQQKLLARSGMVVGLQESLTTISVYILWFLGVLMALNFMGLNTTTLALAFGALGIGLGFGLQNIFNNFVSGIILLLERPIQVGDDIQINDIWARVRKINVRSTVVQTYDNASLIIPNSDLISNQVMNWSFKDKRLRRGIVVGVAYGSDLELVRQTLLDAAAETPRVLKQPKPDVIFNDFGDSSLVFTLRFWTNIAYYLSVETDVRFTIDRLFRERNITIPFPQRDVHMHYNNDPSGKMPKG